MIRSKTLTIAESRFFAKINLTAQTRIRLKCSGNSIGGMTSANQGVDSTFERFLSRNDGQAVASF